MDLEIEVANSVMYELKNILNFFLLKAVFWKGDKACVCFLVFCL